MDIVCSGQFSAHTCLSLSQQKTIFSSSHRLIGFVGLLYGIYQPDKPTTVELLWNFMTVLALGVEAAKTNKRYEMFYQYSLLFHVHGYCMTKGNPYMLYESVTAFVNFINVTMIVNVNKSLQ